MAKRSPLKVVCKADVFGRPKAICRWTCVAPTRGAQFRDRHDSSQYAVVHPSTKKSGWQVSFFDAKGPSGDVQATTCDAAVKELHPSRWRLIEAVSDPKRRR